MRPHFSLLTLLAGTLALAVLLHLNLRVRNENLIEIHSETWRSNSSFSILRLADGTCEYHGQPTRHFTRLYAQRHRIHNAGWPCDLYVAQPYLEVAYVRNPENCFAQTEDETADGTLDFISEREFLQKYSASADKIRDIEEHSPAQGVLSKTRIAQNVGIALAMVLGVMACVEFLVRRRALRTP